MTDIVFRRKGDKRRRRYAFSGPECIGATMSGSRSTGKEMACCLTRAYHGCPLVVIRSDELVRERRVEGWVRA